MVESLRRRPEGAVAVLRPLRGFSGAQSRLPGAGGSNLLTRASHRESVSCGARHAIGQDGLDASGRQCGHVIGYQLRLDPMQATDFRVGWVHDLDEGWLDYTSVIDELDSVGPSQRRRHPVDETRCARNVKGDS